MSISTIQIVIDAQDRASKSIESVRGRLLSLTKTTKGIKRAGSGLKAVAGAVDVLAGSDIHPIIGQLTTLALVADPLTDMAEGVASKVTPAFQKMGHSLGEASAGGIALGLGSVAAGAGIAIAIDQIGADIKRQAESMSNEQIQTGRESFGGQILLGMNQAFKSGLPNVFGPNFQGFLDELAGTSARQAGENTGDQFALAGVKALTDSWRTEWDKARDIFKQSARDIDGDLATALQDNTGVIDTAMEKVAYAIAHPMELQRQLANIEGALTTLEYKRGLATNTDEINTVIDQQMKVLTDQWAEISGKAYDKGVATTDSYQAGLNSGPNPHMPPVTYGTGFKGDRYTNPNRRASGGPVSAGQTYLVGEKGPELLHMGGRGGNITPNAGGRPIIVNIDGRELFRIMDERMGKALAMSGSAGYTRS